MQMPKHSDEAKAAFVNGNMFVGLFGDDIGVKLDPTALEELGALPGSGPSGPAERPMGGYLSLPADLPDAEKSAWTDRARDYTATLPPKVKKK